MYWFLIGVYWFQHQWLEYLNRNDDCHIVKQATGLRNKKKMKYGPLKNNAEEGNFRI